MIQDINPNGDTFLFVKRYVVRTRKCVWIPVENQNKCDCCAHLWYHMYGTEIRRRSFFWRFLVWPISIWQHVHWALSGTFWKFYWSLIDCVPVHERVSQHVHMVLWRFLLCARCPSLHMWAHVNALINLVSLRAVSGGGRVRPYVPSPASVERCTKCRQLDPQSAVVVNDTI